ncbi:hypothetical protein WJ972_04705 [Achromobacter insuavis]
MKLSAGLFNGLIYAAVAVGLALIWGITDVINFAHGEFLMLGMYAAYWLYTLGHIDPTLSAPWSPSCSPSSVSSLMR